MVNNNMTNVDDIKDKMIRDLDKYDKEGAGIKKEIVSILMQHDISPIIAHMLLREIIEVIEEEDPVIKLANKVYDNIKKK